MFHDLVTQAESHELFLQSIHGTCSLPAAFYVQRITRIIHLKVGEVLTVVKIFVVARDVVKGEDHSYLIRGSLRYGYEVH